MDYLGRSIVLIKQNMIIQIIIISMTMSNKTIGTTISESPVT